LWEDGRTDEDQMQGLTYGQLERAMDLVNLNAIPTGEDVKLVDTYSSIRKNNLHKMDAIPIFKTDKTQ